MDEALHVFQPTYALVESKLDVFLGERAASVMAQVSGPLRAALVLYVLLYGFAILRGAINEPMMDFVVRGLKLAFIYTLATTPAYSTYVTDPLFHVLPDTLARAIGGGAVPDPGAAFDQFLSRAAYLSAKLTRGASALNLLAWLMAAGVYLFGAIAAAIGFGVVLLAKVALALLIALGPIFIACALFDASRRFFFGWLSQAVNYLVLFALIIAVFQLVLTLVDEQWGQIDGQEPMIGGFLFIALSILAAIFFLQTPVIAAGIAGGASVGLADFANAAGLGRAGRAQGSQSQRTAPKGGATKTPAEGGE